MIVVVFILTLGLVQSLVKKKILFTRHHLQIRPLSVSVEQNLRSSPVKVGASKRETNFFSKEYIDDILKKFKLSELVSGCVELKKLGHDRYSSCCPFHEEKTPSFHINDSKGVYYCFGCKAKGNGINFIMERQSINFVEAVMFLSDKYGGKLELSASMQDKYHIKKEGNRDQQRVLQLASEFYHNILVSQEISGSARKFLRERHISPALTKKFGLGYSPESSAMSLVKCLLDEGLSRKMIFSSGLTFLNSRSNNGSRDVDNLHGRLIIPLRDQNGNTVGFGARTLPFYDGDTYVTTSTAPKYLNTRESELFKKSNYVYGLDNASESIRKEDLAVIVEGYFDVLCLHEAGVRFVVGCLGSSLSQTQIELASKFSKSKRIVICMDADRAGEQSVKNFCTNGLFNSASQKGIEIRVANIASSSAEMKFSIKDPSDFVLHYGPETENKFRTAVLGVSKPWTEWYCYKILDEHQFETDAIEFKTCVIILREFFRTLTHSPDQIFLVYKVAEILSCKNISMRLRLETDFISDISDSNLNGFVSPNKSVYISFSNDSLEKQASLAPSKNTDALLIDHNTVSQSRSENFRGYISSGVKTMSNKNLFSSETVLKNSRVKTKRYHPSNTSSKYESISMNDMIDSEFSDVALQYVPKNDKKLKYSEQLVLQSLIHYNKDRIHLIELLKLKNLSDSFSTPERQWLFDQLINLPIHLLTRNQNEIVDYLIEKAQSDLMASFVSKQRLVQADIWEKINGILVHSPVSGLFDLYIEDAAVTISKASSIRKVDFLLQNLNELSRQLQCLESTQQPIQRHLDDISKLKDQLLQISDNMEKTQIEISKCNEQQNKLKDYVKQQVKPVKSESSLHTENLYWNDPVSLFSDSVTENSNDETPSIPSDLNNHFWSSQIHHIADEYDAIMEARQNSGFMFNDDIPMLM